MAIRFFTWRVRVYIVLKLVNATDAGASYEFGPFRLDPRERALTRDGESISLVSKSFDLLYVLVQNSGRLLDKDSLLNSVWPDAAVEENSLAKAITEIRKALGERPRENRFIATVARRGYRFLPKVTTQMPGPAP